MYSAGTFLSTPSARRATEKFANTAGENIQFLSTPSARRATSFCPARPRAGRKFLSTPSARRATTALVQGLAKGQISIHALREEGDFGYLRPCPERAEFLSTPSARRATPTVAALLHWSTDFYPRPPRGGRHPAARPAGRPFPISIHALREEGDQTRVR